jgi:hypothetical protein
MIQNLSLEDDETTYKTDYKCFPINPAQLVGDNQERSPPDDKTRRKPAFQVNIETLETYEPNVYVPFDTFRQPKPILQTSPDDGFGCMVSELYYTET